MSDRLTDEEFEIALNDAKFCAQFGITDYDSADYLHTEEEAQAFMREMSHDGDPCLIEAAEEIVNRARAKHGF